MWPRKDQGARYVRQLVENATVQSSSPVCSPEPGLAGRIGISSDLPAGRFLLRPSWLSGPEYRRHNARGPTFVSRRGYPDAYADSDRHSHPDAYADSDRHSHPYAYADSDASASDRAYLDSNQNRL